MRTEDLEVFRAAAVEFKCWLLVRDTNESSLKYVGQAGYVPKPIDCKAKTANRAGHPLAGLVVDPVRVPEAFKPEALHRVQLTWQSFADTVMRGSLRYSVVTDESSAIFGCVLLHGSKLHGDYDLKDIVPVARERQNLALVGELHGQKHMRGPLFYKIQSFVNGRIGAEMVQHGGEAQYADHSDEPIHSFSPDGEYKRHSGLLQIQEWYEEIGRQTLGPKYDQDGRKIPAPQGVPGWKPRVIPGGKV